LALTIRRDGVGADAKVSICHTARDVWVGRQVPVLAVWPFILTRVMHDIRTGHAPTEEKVAAGFFSIGAVALLALFIWALFGREIAIIRPGQIELHNELGRLRIKKVFEIDGIGTIHITPPATGMWRQRRLRHDQIGFGLFKSGDVEFDYNAKLYRFGDGLHLVELAIVMRAIAEIAPDKTPDPAFDADEVARDRRWTIAN
jgi:hypothetical protein